MKRIDDLWYGRGAGSLTVRAALWPVAKAYDLAMEARKRLYDTGVFEVETPTLPAISVGNLTVGGTGKTPFAAWLAGEMKRRARPAIALRGYGRDEVEVHRRLNPDVAVVVNANRAAAIVEAKARGADVVVLDDAFQHHRIARSADILLLSVEQMARPRRLLPAGPWREHLAAARRADLIVLTHKAASETDVAQARAAAAEAAPEVPVAEVWFAPKELVAVEGGATAPLGELRGSSVLAIASVAEPGLFRRQLEAAGADVTLAAYRDHHEFSAGEIESLVRHVPEGGVAVCTLKDAVKLAGRWPGPSRLWYVSQQLVVQQGAELLEQIVKRVLDARAKATSSAAS